MKQEHDENNQVSAPADPSAPSFELSDLEPRADVRGGDGATQTIAASTSPTAQTREHILLARQVGVPG